VFGYFRPLFLYLLLLVAQSTGASAQKASATMAADPLSTYTIIKHYIDSRQSHGDFIQGNEPGVELNYLRLVACNSSDAFYPVKGSVQKTFVDLAFIVVFAERTLKANNYPSIVWVEPLNDFERSYLIKIKAGYTLDRDYEQIIRLGEELSSKINSRITKNGLRLKPVSVHPECGGPVNKIRVSVKPEDAKASIIPKMFYIYCQKIGVNPDDKAQCDQWLPPIRNGDKLFMGGVYKFRIEREGTKSAIREFDADRALENGSITLE
jgi:hypothetical protein